MKRCTNTINTIMINTIKILNENQIRIKYENKDSQILTKIDNTEDYNIFYKFKGNYYA